MQDNREFNIIRNSKDYIEMDLYNKMSELTRRQDTLANVAKVYILDNYDKVDDYSHLCINVIRNGQCISYGKKYIREEIDSNSDIFKDIMVSLSLDRTEIKTISNIEIDPDDFDMSISINGGDRIFIKDSDIFRISYYIEDKLKNKQNA